MKNDFRLHKVMALRSRATGNISGAFLAKKKQPGLISRVPIQNQVRKAKANVTSDFMQVMLSGIPVLSSPVDQVELFLPDGVRLVVTGEKSMSLISSILKSQ